MSKTEKQPTHDRNVSTDPLLAKKEDTRTEREKFVDEFTERYQDKNPHDQAEAIIWAIETVCTSLLLAEKKDK